MPPLANDTRSDEKTKRTRDDSRSSSMTASRSRARECSTRVLCNKTSNESNVDNDTNSSRSSSELSKCAEAAGVDDKDSRPTAVAGITLGKGRGKPSRGKGKSEEIMYTCERGLHRSVMEVNPSQGSASYVETTLAAIAARGGLIVDEGGGMRSASQQWIANTANNMETS